MSCAKTAEPIEMPFGMLSLVDPRNYAQDWNADATTGRSTFREVSGQLQNEGFYGIGERVSCAKTGASDHNDVYVVI